MKSLPAISISTDLEIRASELISNIISDKTVMKDTYVKGVSYSECLRYAAIIHNNNYISLRNLETEYTHLIRKIPTNGK